MLTDYHEFHESKREYEEALAAEKRAKEARRSAAKKIGFFSRLKRLVVERVLEPIKNVVVRPIRSVLVRASSFASRKMCEIYTFLNRVTTPKTLLGQLFSIHALATLLSLLTSMLIDAVISGSAFASPQTVLGAVWITAGLLYAWTDLAARMMRFACGYAFEYEVVTEPAS